MKFYTSKYPDYFDKLDENILCTYIERVLSQALCNSLSKDIETHVKRYDYSFFEKEMKSIYAI